MVQVADPKVGEIAIWLKNQYRPIRLFLYGSRAKGTHREDSDYDFVMVLAEFESKRRLDEMMKITSLVRKALGVEAQVWIYSMLEFEERIEDFSSIPETALNTGIELNLA